MRRSALFLAMAGLAGLGGFWLLTAPDPLAADTFAGLTADPARGEQVFTAAGCASCHMAAGATGDARLVLSGGQVFPSAFGSFTAPNISSDPQAGIGAWSVQDLGNALQRGIGPGGEHLYPALPYAAYRHMTAQDVADLHAYLMTLPADATPSQPHDLSFPFTFRRGLGLWKALFVPEDYALPGAVDPVVDRGRYIVEALAHCGECHTPRNALGGLDRGRWLAGAPNPSGAGTIPDITPAGLDWSEEEIVEYLTSGFTPDYDSVGGHMAHVVENLSRLPESDRRAVASYLKRVPPAE